MTDTRVEDLNIVSCSRLVTPEQLKSELPLTEKAAASVMKGRNTIKDILDHKDKRLFIVVGPCSIHDPAAAMDYAERLKKLAAEVEDTLYRHPAVMGAAVVGAAVVVGAVVSLLAELLSVVELPALSVAVTVKV